MTGNTCSAGVGTTGAGNCIAAIACGPANKTIADTNNPKRRIVCFAITFPCARQPATKCAKSEYFKIQPDIEQIVYQRDRKKATDHSVLIHQPGMSNRGR
ncbi:hypothetical protein [Bradyrhizobium sp. CCBAU 51765]|uniref:hypothetical protein n=1 Tax=Bradyrhizobium sp. CCBAU 51765 TaxID=1325102 RepID=UPI0018884A0E|nr:hypothetical protein [Bradyrhizobium sp. CCBAU 51765]